MKRIRYFSLFSGIAGFELGIGKKGQCVGFSEIDKYAVQIYKKHFPKHKNYGDITKIDERRLPKFDVLCGGFPCQSFSIAGKRGGFEDTRGTLFFDIARIAKHCRPRLLFLENVKGLLSHENGRTFNTIIATLDELGYDVQWQVLNSKNFGVPQNRERVFIIGHLRETPRPQVFPFTENSSEDIVLPTITTRVTADSNGTYVGKGSTHQINSPKHSNERVYGTGGVSPTLNTMQGGNRQPKIIAGNQRGEVREMPISGSPQASKSSKQFSYLKVRETEDGFHQFRDDKKKSSIQGTHVTYPKGKTHALSTAHKPMVMIPEATRGGYSIAKEGDSINLAVPNSKTRRGRVGKGIAQTLDTGMQQHTLTSDMQIRRLTPMECERLQGFPDGWTEGVSDSQRYKMCGNAVTVNVIEAIAKKLL